MPGTLPNYGVFAFHFHGIALFAVQSQPTHMLLLTTSFREDGTIDHSGKPITGGLTNGTHKLGPKANQGAINAGLRALDRSGKPCRKWERKPIQLKSFTGVMWELPSWRAPKTRLPEEETTESKPASQPSGSKANDSSTAMGSEKSNAGENGIDAMIESTPAASSPLPAPLLPTVAATG
jgi:INO80 complex subunit Ies4